MNRLYTWNFLIAFLAQTAFTTTNSLLAHYSRWVEFLGGDVATVGTVSAVSALVGLVLDGDVTGPLRAVDDGQDHGCQGPRVGLIGH